jgi:TolB-like protein
MASTSNGLYGESSTRYTPIVDNGGMSNILTELKRRNVFRVAAAYTVVAWIIAQAFDLGVDNFGAPDWVMKVLLAILIAGLPVALLLAWAFELTPDGVVKTEDVPESESITPSTGKMLNRITTAALVLLLAFVAWDKLGPGGDSTDPADAKPSVAVLPFADLSEMQDQEWFADGLTEEILNALARLPELRVTARTSSFEFKNTNTNVAEIANRLGVAHVVEGSVRRIGDNLRVTAQLIRASDGFHMWSDTYDRSTEDLFDVQRDVAENIATTLDVILDDEKRNRMLASGTRNVEAFEAFSKGRDLYDKAHARDPIERVTLAEANVYFERAMELEPGYSQAAILHADRYAHRLIEGNAPIIGDAAALDATNAYSILRRDFGVAVVNAPDPISRVIADLNREFFAPHWHRLPGLIEQLKTLVSPGDSLSSEILWLHEILLLSGEIELAEIFAESSKRDDPIGRGGWEDSLEIYIRRREWEAASALIGQLRRNLGDRDRLHEYEIQIANLQGDRVAALRALEGDIDLSGELAHLRPMLAAFQGDEEKAVRLATEIENATAWPNYYLIWPYFQMGDHSRLRDLVQRVDALAVGPTILGLELAFNGGVWTFDLDDAPNFRKRLEEAQIDPSSFEVLPISE